MGLELLKNTLQMMNYSDFRDHKLSADPEEMTKLVEHIRETENMLGDGKLKISESEFKNLMPTRRSLAAKNLFQRALQFLSKILSG